MRELVQVAAVRVDDEELVYAWAVRVGSAKMKDDLSSRELGSRKPKARGGPRASD
jgi:hypothetical protein